jgi:hypothetical protein
VELGATSAPAAPSATATEPELKPIPVEVISNI